MSPLVQNLTPVRIPRQGAHAPRPPAPYRFPATCPSTPAAGAPSTVVVQPGDTLWSIAAAVAPDTDVRITVDQLIELNGSSPIVPGQELVLPG